MLLIGRLPTFEQMYRDEILTHKRFTDRRSQLHGLHQKYIRSLAPSPRVHSQHVTCSFLEYKRVRVERVALLFLNYLYLNVGLNHQFSPAWSVSELVLMCWRVSERFCITSWKDYNIRVRRCQVRVARFCGHGNETSGSGIARTFKYFSINLDILCRAGFLKWRSLKMINKFIRKALPHDVRW